MGIRIATVMMMGMIGKKKKIKKGLAEWRPQPALKNRTTEFLGGQKQLARWWSVL